MIRSDSFFTFTQVTLVLFIQLALGRRCFGRRLARVRVIGRGFLFDYRLRPRTWQGILARRRGFFVGVRRGSACSRRAARGRSAGSQSATTSTSAAGSVAPDARLHGSTSHSSAAREPNIAGGCVPLWARAVSSGSAVHAARAQRVVADPRPRVRGIRRTGARAGPVTSGRSRSPTARGSARTRRLPRACGIGPAPSSARCGLLEDVPTMPWRSVLRRVRPRSRRTPSR